MRTDSQLDAIELHLMAENCQLRFENCFYREREAVRGDLTVEETYRLAAEMQQLARDYAIRRRAAEIEYEACRRRQGNLLRRAASLTGDDDEITQL